MKKSMARWLSLLLCLAMAFSLASPALASAGGDGGNQEGDGDDITPPGTITGLKLGGDIRLNSTGETSYELKLEPDEDPFDAIRRELKEEIGATAGRWDPLGYMMPSVGYTDEMLYLYLARDLTFGDTHWDQDEFLEPFKLPFAEALSQAADGRISDGKTVAALFRADRIMREEANE